MKVHLGKFHAHSPKGCSLLSSMVILIVGAELQGFKVDIINIEIYRCTSRKCRFGRLQPCVYSIEYTEAEPSYSLL